MKVLLYVFRIDELVCYLIALEDTHKINFVIYFIEQHNL